MPTMRAHAWVWAIVGAAAVSGCAQFGCAGDPPPPPPAPPPVQQAAAVPDASVPPPEQPHARVVASMGRVEIRRIEAVKWAPLQLGDRVFERDALRTDADAQVELQSGDILVSVEERSHLELRTVSPALVRASVRGRVGSTVKAGAVEFEADATDAVIRSEGGTFTMTSDGNGLVAVGAVTGKVDFTGNGRTVVVEEGEISRLRGKRGPDKPKKGLQKVLLAVKWPPQKETRHATVPVRGVVAPGTRVKVQGAWVPVDARGRFKTNVRLRDGHQKVVVRGVDALGRTKSAEIAIFRDARAPDVDLRNKPWDTAPD